MTAYISDLDVSINETEEKELQSQGFMNIDVDLNKGAGGNRIYLWYKNDKSCPKPITKVEVTFNEKMRDGLTNAGYTPIYKNLNAGNKGDVLYLWYFRGSGEYNTPIVDVSVTADAHNEAVKYRDGWERVACDLNRHAGGNWIHLWLKREKQTYICDVTATNSYGSDSDKLKFGYIRVDETTNRGTDGAPVFIWFLQTTDSKCALIDVNISITPEQYQELQQQNYNLVNVDLNEGTGGAQVYLWYKKQGYDNPIKALPLLVNTDLADEYEKAGLTVIRRNLNAGNHGHIEYLCVWQ